MGAFLRLNCVPGLVVLTALGYSFDENAVLKVILIIVFVEDSGSLDSIRLMVGLRLRLIAFRDFSQNVKNQILVFETSSANVTTCSWYLRVL